MKIRNLIINSTILLIASCHPVLADGKDEIAIGGTVHDHYRNIVVQQNPVKVQVCKNVTTSGDKSGDMVAGAIIGGIIGISIARELKSRNPGSSICMLEKEDQCGIHASGRNSGVLHAGFYYTADSLKGLSQSVHTVCPLGKPVLMCFFVGTLFCHSCRCPACILVPSS